MEPELEWLIGYRQYVANLLLHDVSLYAEKKLKFKLPHFSIQSLICLCNKVQDMLSSEPTMLNLNSNDSSIIIVGDLHGHFLDLLRVIQKNGSPENQRYLFLGDLVDRGEFSLETITLIFAMKVLFPQNIYIIRGNHEFLDVFEGFGFGQEIATTYFEENPKSLITAFARVFSMLPIACLIDNKYFCVHGGIGSNISSILQINLIKRPISTVESNEAVAELLWSDPSETIPFFMPSNRGTGFFYGPKAIEAFLKTNKIQHIIRAHQCVQTGILINSDKTVITVFSASNYCGTTNNSGGILIISQGEYKEVVYPSLPYIKRNNVIFLENESETKFILNASPSRKPPPPPTTYAHPFPPTLPLGNIPSHQRKQSLPALNARGGKQVQSERRRNSLSGSKNYAPSSLVAATLNPLARTYTQTSRALGSYKQVEFPTKSLRSLV